MTFLFIGDILGFIDAFSGLELRAVHLELVSIDHEVSEAVFLIDLCLDGNGALVGEASAKLDVMDGEIIVRRFGPDIEVRNLTVVVWGESSKKRQLTKRAERLCPMPLLRSYYWPHLSSV